MSGNSSGPVQIIHGHGSAIALGTFQNGFSSRAVVMTPWMHGDRVRSHKGFNPGVIDSILGADASKAVTEFQAQLELPQTGRPDGPTIAVLSALVTRGCFLERRHNVRRVLCVPGIMAAGISRPAQLIRKAFVIVGLATAGTLGWLEIAVLGASLALSSTAIALPMLQEKNRLPTAVGRDALAVLLLPGIAFVPLEALVPLLSSGHLLPHLPSPGALARAALSQREREGRREWRITAV